MIATILAAVDGSGTAKKAAEYAIGLAKLSHAHVVLLSVIDRSPFVGKPIIPASRTPTHLIEALDDFLKEDAELNIAEVEEIAQKEGVPATKLITNGHAVEEIVKQAEMLNADLIVMGSHGRSALDAALLGSVTFGVIHKDTRIPVLVVRKWPD